MEKYFERELRNALYSELKEGLVIELAETSPFFSRLESLYPVSGSRIDWSKVDGSITRVEYNTNNHVLANVAFFLEMYTCNFLSGNVIYICDGEIDFGLCADIYVMARVSKNIFEMPQHHYFFREDFSWCMCFMMEGDMGFGFSPRL